MQNYQDPTVRGSIFVIPSVCYQDNIKISFDLFHLHLLTHICISVGQVVNLIAVCLCFPAS